VGRTLLILLFVIFLTPLVQASQPSPEMECCFYYEGGDVPEECNEYELSEEKCSVWVQEWNTLMNQMDRGLETCYDKNMVNYDCDDPNLCYDDGMVVDCENPYLPLLLIGLAIFIIIRSSRKK